jgi:Fur family transcriptional regulator, ferric uptake regulator
MISTASTTWADRAEATLADAGHKRGGARRALLELLAETGIRAEGACLPASVETGTDSGDTRCAPIPESASAEGACLPASAGQRCALTAHEIEDALRAGSPRAVSRASIYRILDELERAGLVARVETGQSMVRYERAHHSAAEHHHHLVCDSCGVVIPFSDTALERAIDELSKRVPLTVSEHEIVLHGACRECTS